MRYWLAFLGLIGLAGCAPETQTKIPADTNIVAVVGAIHGQHRKSNSYSLDILRGAINKFDPDIVMVELPPDRFAKARENYEKFGEVRESRADDFPELIDVVFPLQKELGFEMVPAAAWTQAIADNRRAVEKRLRNDQERNEDWASHEVAIERYSKTVAGRSDDPEYIHSAAYDAAVKDRQESYEWLFGRDLGEGGWKAINTAHVELMNSALDENSGREKRILILFGAWHKYKILEALEARTDIHITDTADLFDR